MESADADRRLLSDPPSLRLDGRVVWITGAGRGLGRALAFAFAGLGAEVVLTARSADELAAVANAIGRAGGVAEVVAGSVADPLVIERARERIQERWGRLDVLVNNAGISPSFVRSEHLPPADWQQVLDVNLSAPFSCCQRALPLLEAAGSASVINISSVHGDRALPRVIAYAASKGGLEMLTRTLAVEWARRGIRVNAVAPGYLETDMTVTLRDHEQWNQALRARIPMDRFAAPAEVVPTVMLLAGPGGSYITGSTIYVDGGWTAQ